MNLAVALLIIAFPVGLYLIIRYRGASIVATFNAGGLSAVLSGFQTWLITLGASILMAAPPLIEAFAGINMAGLVGEPWATLWNAFVPTIALGLASYLRAQSTTPSGTKPTGEA
jgi:hypothetical protein